MAEYNIQRLKMRYRCEVDVELTGLECGIRVRTRTSTLSAGGCGISTLSSFPRRTTVKVKLIHNNVEMVALGRVVYSRQDLGMGIAFISMDASDERILCEWIEDFMELQNPRK
jgi:hypothetical protein